MATLDFREISAAIHGNELKDLKLDLNRNSVTLAFMQPEATGRKLLSVTFEELTAFRWQASGAAEHEMRIAIAGLERLGPGEPWRLYLAPKIGKELELTCRRITSDGVEITGVGRSYHN